MSQYGYMATRATIIGVMSLWMLTGFSCQSPKTIPSTLPYVIHSQNKEFTALQYADSLALFISKKNALETFKTLEMEHRDNPKVYRYIRSRITSLRAQLEIPDSAKQNKIFTTDPTNIFEVIADYDVHYNLKPNTILIEPLKELVAQQPGFYPTVLALNRIGLFYKNVCFDLDSSWQYFSAARDTLEKIDLITLEHVLCYENLLTLSVYKRKNLDAIMYGNELCDFVRYSWKPDSLEMARGFINRAFVLFREGDNTGSKLDNSLAKALIDSSRDIKEYQFILRNEILFSRSFDSEENFEKNNAALSLSIQSTNHDFVNLSRLNASYLTKNKRYKEAIPHLIKALNYDLNQLHHNFATHSNICDLFSDSYISLGQFDKALIYIAKNEYINEFSNEQSIYEYLKSHPESAYSFTTTISCANLFFEKFLKTNQLKDLKIADKYIELVNENMYNQFNIADEHSILQFYLETGNFFFQLAMKINYTLYNLTKDNRYLEKFINYSEKSKNSLLNRDISIFNQWTSLSNELIEKEKYLRFLQHKEILKGYRNNPEFNRIQKMYNRISHEIESQDLNYSTNKLISTKESLSEIKDKIGISTSIISTAHFENQIYITLINKNGVELFKLYSDSMLVNTMNRIDSIINSDTKTDTFTLNQLYSILKKSLFPNDFEIKLNKNIIVIPDGLFHRLPLQLLLATYHNISYSPSIQIINPENSNFKLIKKVAAFAFSDDETIMANKRSSLNELPGTIKEVNKLRLIHTNIEIYSGHNATKENFLKVYEDTTVEYIHLAVHGFANSNVKNDVKLYFRTAEGGIDSLYGFELLGIKSNVKKVVLSACQSTIGKYVEGEGNFSLIRYFLINGAKEVQASNYNLLDKNFESYNLYKYIVL